MLPFSRLAVAIALPLTFLALQRPIGQAVPSVAHERQPAGAAAVADFRDLAAAAGLTARTVIGGEHTKDFILETTGGGVAILDYDNDGWPDIFLVNGARLAQASPDTAPASHLYRNRGDGTFVDVTEKAGATSWGSASVSHAGTCSGTAG